MYVKLENGLTIQTPTNESAKGIKIFLLEQLTAEEMKNESVYGVI